jgi:uncharacterized protein (TIGR00299 family) protein
MRRTVAARAKGCRGEERAAVTCPAFFETQPRRARSLPDKIVYDIVAVWKRGASMPEHCHVHLDAVGGVAGDMFAAALLDALPSLRDRVVADMAAVLPPGCGAPELTPGTSGGMPALRLHLTAADRAARPTGGFRDIRAHIERASLAEGTANHAIAILGILAKAESRVHQVAVDDVHFHEIADWDSVMDVVAAGSVAAALGGATWSVSDLPMGGGLVRTRHGLLPVPAPATAEILKGFRWRDDGVGGERVTPTGAAILAHLIGVSATQTPAPSGVLTAVGAGAGAREWPGLPNILRVLVFAGGGAAEGVIVLSFDVDDMTGEEIGVAAERLRATDGVLDLTIGTRMGKKSRPSHDFRLLVNPSALTAVQDLCLTETSTIGLRWRLEQRVCLERRVERRMVAGRAVETKQVSRPDGTATVKAQSDDVSPVDGLARRRALARDAEND